MALDLVKEKNRLSGNSMGRSVMETCSLHQLIESEKAWREHVSRKAATEKFLQNIAGETEVSGDKRRKRKRSKIGGTVIGL
jgi:hypothetical protein